MFEHSIKVPRLYKLAAKVAKQVKEEGASLKDKIYQRNHSNIKGLYALITTLFQKSNTLDYIIRSTQILIRENRLDPWLARVLITELLWGKNRLPNDNKPCQTILKFSKEITDCLATFTDDAPTQQSNKVKIKKPRYVRVNTLNLTTTEAINIFRDEGWILLRCGENSDYGSFLATVASLSADQFIVDMHVKDLLIFPPNTQFYKHHLYLNGDIVLQDKASCLAPVILSPEPKSSVLDMCSAPGMKASHLAAIVGKEGTVYAVERDQRRYQTLVTLMDGMSAKNVKCINKDVLTVTNQEFPNIEYILVDPSCSGSGMLDRLDIEDPESKFNQSRLNSLAGFQITILRHALYNFPNAKRVLYSTCSVYPEENESVVEQVITTVKDFKLVDLTKTMKPKWFNFGSKDFKNIGERCLYAKPEQDYTNGFFVALFERLNDGETNEFFVKRVKRSSECDNSGGNHENEENGNPEVPKSKKKKNKFDKKVTEDNENVDKSAEKKSRKRKKSKNDETVFTDITQEVSNESKRKKKKKSKNDFQNKNDVPSNENDTISEESKQKKKKKSKICDQDVTPEVSNEINVTEEGSNKTKQKKKKKSKKDFQNGNDLSSNVNDNISEETKPEKKKKSKISDVDITTEISNENEQKNEKKSKKKQSSDVDKNISKETKKDKKSKNVDTTQEISEKDEKKKQKSKKNLPNEESENEVSTENKKRKKKHDINDSVETNEGSIKKKKKSKHVE